MRLFPLAAAVAALLVPAAPAFAGDPIMPLWQVHAGMACTAYSVVQGTTISSFDIEVLDVAGGEATSGGGRILFRASGPAVDATGLGPGFSGSPIYCPDEAGVSRVIGAISESINEYGGKTALATPIEAVIGTPVDVPGKPNAATTTAKAAAAKGRAAGAGGSGASGASARNGAIASGATGRPAGAGGASAGSGSKAGAASAAREAAARAAFERRKPSARMRAAMASARPIASPLTVSGLSAPVADALVKAGEKAGRPILVVPPGPLATFPVQTLRPGSAVAVGYSNGDVRTSSVGTVAYVDGDRVWVFGHQLEAAGRRALLLQDAYVFRVINNPLQLGTIGATYKLAASGHDLGTVTSDGFAAVAGRTGALPHTVGVSVVARDLDDNGIAAVNTQVADEAAVDLPSGGSWTSFIAPLAVSQAANGVLGNTPGRLTGEMCARIGLAELKEPLRFCNRYVSTALSQGDDGTSVNAVLSGASNDLAGALSAIDAYTGTPPRVTGVNVSLKLHRGADQVFMRSVRLPAKVRPGQKVRARVELQRVRGNAFARNYTFKVPSSTKTGSQRVRFVGTDADEGESGFTTIILGGDDQRSEGGDPGPATLRELASEVESTERYDGVSVRIGRAHGEAFRDPAFRISGQAETNVRVVRR